ncbi:MAG TPA: MBL fold metallo-hydrolase, partial [Verrucomicrobiae bacterium]|nr:MBL fold metallo-hydrolase [Verrucomicrobiae bacterium]
TVLAWKGYTIYVDPVNGASAYAGLPRADLVLVTHSHGDHFDSATITGIKGTKVLILAPANVQSSLPTSLKTNSQVMINGSTTNVPGITIDAIPSYNFTSGNHPKGVGNGYVLTIGGRRFYFAGDTDDIPEMRALSGIDVAFLPAYAQFTMSAAKAADAARQFKPRIVYPYHYASPTATAAQATPTANQMKQLIGTDLGIEVRLRKWY